MEGLEYKDNGLCIQFFPNFLSAEESKDLYDTITSPSSGIFTESRLHINKRINTTFGDENISYNVRFKNGTVTRVARPWDECPVLLTYRDRLEKFTGKSYNYVVVQYYPSGKTGISPHRDKEMAPETDIAGISVGDDRTLLMTPPSYIRGSTSLEIPLTDRSLYILKPPTDDHWSHSIPPVPLHENLGSRVSLTYRYVAMG